MKRLHPTLILLLLLEGASFSELAAYRRSRFNHAKSPQEAAQESAQTAQDADVDPYLRQLQESFQDDAALMPIGLSQDLAAHKEHRRENWGLSPESLYTPALVGLFDAPSLMLRTRSVKPFTPMDPDYSLIKPKPYSGKVTHLMKRAAHMAGHPLPEVPRAHALMNTPRTAPKRIREGSLWKSPHNHQLGLIANRTARRIGDLVTVTILEKNDFTNKRQKDFNRSSTLNDQLQRFLYNPANYKPLRKYGELPGMQFNGTNSRNATGNIKDENQINATIVAQVTSIDMRGNLFIEGRQSLKYAGEEHYGILTGIVKPEDIAANNTVLSTKIAQLNLEFISEGDLEKPRKKGWFTKLYDIVSPF